MHRADAAKRCMVSPSPQNCLERPRDMSDLTHFDESGASRMVDVGGKAVTARMARAEAIVTMQPQTLVLIQDRRLAKGDVFEVARLAGIMAAKRTPELILLCHSLGLDSATVDFEILDESRLRIEASVAVQGRTGVEMEAMTAVSIAALTVYDMVKSVDRGLEIGPVRLLEKSGGKSGHFVRPPSGDDSAS
jgi:cyclic pyranopterin monophosphate synthase